MSATVYATYDEAVQAEVIAPIENGDVRDARAAFDIDLLGGILLYFEDAYDEATDTYRLDGQGWRLKPPFANPREFWAVIEGRAS